MKARIEFTTADSKNNYEKTRNALIAETNDTLTREYMSLTKHGFNSVFGRNARTFQNLIADELFGRGIEYIPDIFGSIKVKKWKR